MRYVKTFENFNHNTTNEGLLWGEGSIWEKAKKWWNTWKNEKMTEGAETFQKVLQENPEAKAYWDKNVQPEFDKLSEEEKIELSAKVDSCQSESIPSEIVADVEKLAKVEEALRNLQGAEEGSRIYESYQLILEEAEEVKQSLTSKILMWLGVGSQYVGAISGIIGAILYFINSQLIMAAGTAFGVILVPGLMAGMIFGGLALALAGTYLRWKFGEE
jgi:hypothetical protein